MGTLSEFFKNPAGVIMAFFLMLFIIKEVFELWKWYKGRADDYHKSKSEKEDFEEKVNHLEADVLNTTKLMVDIQNTLEALHKRLDEYETDRREDFVVSSRATLYRLYDEFNPREELSLSEFETFSNLADRYLANGGNGVFRNKIIPEIREKPIKDD